MKKNRFLTFLFSLIPGCGLMYLGYMKKGLQFMLMFAAAGLVGGFFETFTIGWFGGLFFAILPAIWFYQMFDAMHTVVRMKNQEIGFPTDDGFIFPEKMNRFSPIQNRTAAKVVAGILILVGGLSLISGVLNSLWRYPIFDQEILGYVNSAIRYNLIPVIVSVLLIIAGIKLLKGGKAKKTDDGYDKGGDLS